MNIQTVTVIGANGTMGQNISGIFASFGGAKVYMVSRELTDAEKARKLAAESVKAGAIIERLIAADYSMLDKCVSKSDLVFEAVFENLSVKEQIASIVAKSIKGTTVYCSGTSGLSITTLAEQFSDSTRGRVFGVHMFNPPYSLNLCELIPTKYSDMTVCDELNKYLCTKLYRTVVKVKDSPAFLGNRIGFQFINESLQYADMYKYNGGIDYIDAILGPFSGRSMAPLVTADFVGLDIHKAITANLRDNTADYANETFILPGFVENLILSGNLGKKTGAGLYRTMLSDDGIKRRMVYDISTDAYRDVMQYHFPFAEGMITNFKVGNYKKAFEILVSNKSPEAEICLQFLLKYVAYSLVATELVGYDIHSADHAMATGFNWCPPLAAIDAFGTAIDFKQLMSDRLEPSIKERIDLDRILEKIEPSKYDYRLFFKAKR